MSQKQTQFIMLPNEVIYFIFDFLTNFDILRSFTQLDRRYDDLVRFYIKRIDLTDGWQGDREQLQLICETIERVKVDEYYVHLLYESDNRERVTSSPIKRTKKFSFRSVVKKIFTRSENVELTSDCCLHRIIPVADFRFPQLHSLELVNVYDWTKVISQMNLKGLSLRFDGSLRHYREGTLIPQTIIRFFTNALVEPNNFHANLITLSICVRTVVQLVEIIEHTPNLQYLHVTFADYFDEHFRLKNCQYTLLETITTNFRRLTNLNRLSFSTKHAKDAESNECWPFDQIEIFMNRCCPDKTTLRKVAMKFDHLMFHKDMWSLIVQYKNTFDRFDFLASFIAEDKTLLGIMISSINDLFDYYIEDGDRLYAKRRFVHIYSLPFAFNQLRGFISCSELSSRTSFSGVRHLYFIPTCLARPISFESLAKRMPYLISIECHFSFGLVEDMIFDAITGGDNNLEHCYNMMVSEITVNTDVFNHVRFLRFTSCCPDARAACRHVLPQLLDHMPQLQCLTSTEEDFIHTQRPLSSMKRLDLRRCRFQSFDSLVQHSPNLSTLLLGDMTPDVKRLAKHLAFLFIGIPSLKLVCFKIDVSSGHNSEQDEKIALQAVTRMRKMNNCLHHLKLDFRYEEAEFYLYNL